MVTAVLVVTLRPARRHVRPGPIYNARLRRLHRRLDRAVARPVRTARRGALWLIGWRVVQGVGGAMLMANSTAILTDAFPADQRGMALGINMVAGIAGSFIGLVARRPARRVDWRAVFWVNVPFGLFGTVWAYRMLHETGVRRAGQASTGGATSPSPSA